MEEEYLVRSGGIFWWNDTPVDSGYVAPDEAVYGTLTISRDGTSRLELDGRLPGLSAMQIAGYQLERNIRGAIKSDNRHVILGSMFTDGGRISSKGISTFDFIAYECFLSHASFPAELDISSAKRMSLSLSGMEEWTYSGGINLTRNDNDASAVYKKKKNINLTMERSQ